MKPNQRTQRPDCLGPAEAHSQEPDFRASERAKVLGTSSRVTMVAGIQTLLAKADKGNSFPR